MNLSGVAHTSDSYAVLNVTIIERGIGGKDLISFSTIELYPPQSTETQFGFLGVHKSSQLCFTMLVHCYPMRDTCLIFDLANRGNCTLSVLWGGQWESNPHLLCSNKCDEIHSNASFYSTNIKEIGGGVENRTPVFRSAHWL